MRHPAPRPQVVGLDAVDRIRGPIGEQLRAEGVLRVEARRGQVQPTAVGRLGGVGEDLFGIGGA
ncbi:hypothetical protein [Streptomyces sp. CoH27]|uniref:hypothetical protein n=1 Tax=Streptomyces sp. CoH27 TaxID=2875763 RepID=UPI001CD701A2|nr:hypothetical protein [Streptomyces sp. CoH27]